MLITLFKKIIRLHSKGLNESWGDVNNKTLANPNERLSF